MKRVLGALGSLLAWFCVATVIAQCVMLFLASHKFHLDRARWMQVVAAAYGIDAPPPQAGAAAKASDGAESPSYDDVIERRALKSRNIELRQQALREGLDQLRTDQKKLAEESLRIKRIRDSFETELASVRNEAASAGIDDVRRSLETIKPKQAKEQILKMLAEKKLDQVVLILAAMPDGKRAKIFGEFKTADEADKLSAILRRIREGVPPVEKVEKTRENLNATPSTGA